MPTLSVMDIARVCHEANRALCEIAGDHSQPLWHVAPDWQKESATQGVRAVINNPQITPEQLHEKWVEAKVTDGWTFGPVKDAERKLHPCLVPYDHLPIAQRRKDVVFRAIVSALAGED